MKLNNLPETLVILGSGWGKAIEGVEVVQELGYEQWLGVKSSVKGHAGKLVVGKSCAYMMGRLHLNEGFSVDQVVEPLKRLAKGGVKRVVVTSAAGALNEKYKVGDVVVLSDLLTLFLPESPLKAGQFQDMSKVFDKKWQVEAGRVLKKEGLSFHEGIYAFARGPHFETFADKRALKRLGADVVGMSTVPEVIAAKSLGMKVLGLSLVTNLAFVSHSHEDVLKAAERASLGLARVLKNLI